MIDIKVLGSGCSKCKVTESQVRRAIDSLNRSDITLTKVDNVEEILKYHVMNTPAVIVNEVVKSTGRVPSVEQIIQFIKEAN